MGRTICYLDFQLRLATVPIATSRWHNRSG